MCEKKTNVIILLSAFILYIILWFLHPQMFIPSDPSAYSQSAFSIFGTGEIGLSKIFDHRVGITFPTAVFYKVFGVNIYSTNLISLISALIIIAVVWMTLSTQMEKLWGALICVMSIPLFKSSVALYPDITATAFMALSTYMLIKRYDHIQSRLWLPYAIMSVIFLFWAFLAKMSAYWVLPLWAMSLLTDMRSDNIKNIIFKFYIPVFITGFLLGVCYLFFTDMIWHDYLARFNVMHEKSGHHLWSISTTDNSELLKRITTAPIFHFINEFEICILLLAILGIIFCPKHLKTWRYYGLICLFLFWFGSTSFSKYEPLPLTSRMSLPIYPAIYIFAAITASKISLLITESKYKNKFYSILFLVIIIGTPFILYASNWQKVDMSNKLIFNKLSKIVQTNTSQNHLVVCSENRSPHKMSFYFDYKYPDNLLLVSINNLTEEMLHNKEYYIYVDKKLAFFLNTSYEEEHHVDIINSLETEPIITSENYLLLKTTKAQLTKLIDLQTH